MGGGANRSIARQRRAAICGDATIAHALFLLKG